MYGFKICVKFERYPLKFHKKILNPYIAKYAFYEVLNIWRVMISQSYDIFGFSETGPHETNQTASEIPWVRDRCLELPWLPDVAEVIYDSKKP